MRYRVRACVCALAVSQSVRVCAYGCICARLKWGGFSAGMPMWGRGCSDYNPVWPLLLLLHEALRFRGESGSRTCVENQCTPMHGSESKRPGRHALPFVSLSFCICAKVEDALVPHLCHNSDSSTCSRRPPCTRREPLQKGRASRSRLENSGRIVSMVGVP